jgi:2-alkyl-3-oxoalkanoate reductase
MSEVNTGMPVLVTGASGFLGAHLAAELQRRGFAVRALARRTSDLDRLAELGVEIVYGDLWDQPSLNAATSGCRSVFHTAARVSDWGSREEFERVNVAGTANVIAACESRGVQRLVHLSSLTVLGLPRDGRTVDENTPTPPSEAGDHYSTSKLAAEHLVRAAHGERGLATTVVRPGAIWGPGDPHVVPRIVGLLRRRLMPYIDGGGNLLGLSHVDNLCSGLVLLANAPQAAGQLYHITDGEEITAHTAIDEVAAAFGLPRPHISLPFWLILAVAACVEGGARLLRCPSPPPLTRYGARFVACHCRYDVGKAARELGYRPIVSFRQGVRALSAGEVA